MRNTVSLAILISIAPFKVLFAEDDTIRFNRDVRAILSDKCFHCHGPDEHDRRGDLRLDTQDGSRAELGKNRFAIVPGKPELSELLRRVSHIDENERMPPPETGKPLSPSEILTLERWIEEGGKYEEHWSFVTPHRPSVPKSQNGNWALDDIDRFLLARMETASVKPSPTADRITLARRVAFDLIGLPPPQSSLREFLEASEENFEAAYAKYVDALLGSEHFGERMAIYWLDLVRFANTVGYHGDQDHSIEPYRDWVIQAFNDDMPFDQFTREQIAGDLLPNSTTDQKIASGYNRLLQTTHEGGAQDKEYLAKYSADRVRNFSSVWMAATVGCAECHNHKYDPYTQKDFYSLAAFFADVKEQGAFNAPNSLPTKRDPELTVLSPITRRKIERLKHSIEELRAEAASSAKPDAHDAKIAKIEAEIAALEKLKLRTMVTVSVKPRDIRVFPRGNWLDTSGELVSPAPPSFLSTQNLKRRATRLDLVDWLVSPENPQTSRVFVNRLWFLLFGQGLSRTLDDIGSQGDWPTHPALLDYLALEFSEGGWKIKPLIRRILLTRAYRQSSVGSAELLAKDPENRLLARQGRFRLAAEMIRDNALAVSQLLIRDIGSGTSRPYQPLGYYMHLNFPTRKYKADQDRSQYRRGVYMHWQRQFLHPMLRAFDAPSREECTAKRPTSNTPVAALNLLNDPSFTEAARVFAERILREGGASVGDRVRWAWRTALTREASHAESAVLEALYARQHDAYQKAPASAEALLGVGLAPVSKGVDKIELAAWVAVARTIFNLNEMITRN